LNDGLANTFGPRRGRRNRWGNRTRSGALGLLFGGYRGSPFFGSVQKAEDFLVGIDRQRLDELAAPENFRQFVRGCTGLEQPLQLDHDVAGREAAGLEGTQNLCKCRRRRR